MADLDRLLARQDALRSLLAERQLEAMLVHRRPNIRWLTGFTGSAGVALVSPDRVILLTDYRYALQAPEETEGAARVEIARTSTWTRLATLLTEAGRGRIGFEAHGVTVRDAERLGDLVPGSLVDAGEVVERLRQVKDQGEVALIRSAAVLALDALAVVLPTVRAGERELDIATRLETELRRRGSEWHPFETIVASGPRSALPHARTTIRELERGDLLLIDFGARVEGYCSDLSRTMVIGPADERQRTIHQLVATAQTAAREGARAGMAGREVDALARNVIHDGGHGEDFGHSLGHGIGLEVHEGPRLGATITDPVPVGAVVTVEPGIYLPGWGGVRLEDDLLLTADGPVLLSDGETALIELDT